MRDDLWLAGCAFIAGGALGFCVGMIAGVLSQ